MRNESKIENRRSSTSNRGSARLSQQARGMQGKGPRSYQRSDKRILEEINDRLCDNPYLDASNMEVSVENGDVFLNGTVESRDDKRLAEEIAEEITGVKNVENRLHVTLKGI